MIVDEEGYCDYPLWFSHILKLNPILSQIALQDVRVIAHGETSLRVPEKI
jgi:hypothetical protein